MRAHRQEDSKKQNTDRDTHTNLHLLGSQDLMMDP